jgi:WASH complex subunit strumpellin
MDILNSENLCGRNLLHIVSRGSATITEILDLSHNVPHIFLRDTKFNSVLFDFEYLKDPECFESKVNGNVELVELDRELQGNYHGKINSIILSYLPIFYKLRVIIVQIF